MTRSEIQRLPGPVRPKWFHFFMQADADFEMADMLKDAGFSSPTAGSTNYGPVHHGSVSEHFVNFRKVIIEEETHCAGFDVKWVEFPGGVVTHAAQDDFTGMQKRWRFQVYEKRFDKGFKILRNPHEPCDDENREGPYAEGKWSQGLAPHYWLYKETMDDAVGTKRSRIIGSNMKHLDLIWARHLDFFDRTFVECLLVAADALLEGQNCFTEIP